MGSRTATVEAEWYAFVVIGIVIVVDISRTIVLGARPRRYGSAALASNALHFASDLAGSAAVLFGLVLVHEGYTTCDSMAALFVAFLVLLAAARLMQRNVDVLMDRAPADAEEAARAAIAGIDAAGRAERLRMRQAGPAVSSRTSSSRFHLALQLAKVTQRQTRSRMRSAPPCREATPSSTSSRRRIEAAIRDRAHAAALGVPSVREVHNVSVLDVEGRTEVSLHLKLPGELTLEAGSRGGEPGRERDRRRRPEVDSVQTHIEPLAVRPWKVSRHRRRPRRTERRAAHRSRGNGRGAARAALRPTPTTGLLAYLTLGLDPSSPLAEAHARASEIEERIRRARPEIADVVVHTEP